MTSAGFGIMPTSGTSLRMTTLDTIRNNDILEGMKPQTKEGLLPGGLHCALLSTTQTQPSCKMLSSIRLLVEHVITGVKRCYIVHEVFRNTKTQFDDLVMEIACGLHNFRTTLRYNTLK
jgi:hypothetical protein